MKAGFLLDGAFRQLPDFLGSGAVLGIGHQHVGRQAVGEGAHFPRGSTGRRLAGKGERTVAGLADLSGEQVDVVDQIVGPDTTGVLVETHGPERHHLALGIGIQLGQRLQPLSRHPRLPGGTLQGVGFDELGELLEGNVAPGIGLGRVLRLLLQRVSGTQAVADVIGALGEAGVPAYELLVDRTALDDVVGDVVEDDQVGLRAEHHGNVGQLETAVLEGRQYRDLDMGIAQAPIGDPGPEDRVHLGHVRAPQHESVGGLDVVVAAHGFIHAKGAHEAHDRRSHAVTGVGVDVVGTQAGLHQLVGGIAFPDRPLPGTEHADRLGAMLPDRRLVLLGHDVEGLLPGHRQELALLVVGAILHTQERLGQAVAAVHHLRQEIALHAVEAPIHFGLDVAVGRHHPAIPGRHHDAATGAAEAARRLVPVQLRTLGIGDQVAGGGDNRQAGGSDGDGRGLRLGEFTAGHAHGVSPSALRSS
ncbi:hypothetical protein D9M69_278650 [compost metagenome]